MAHTWWHIWDGIETRSDRGLAKEPNKPIGTGYVEAKRKFIQNIPVVGDYAKMVERNQQFMQQQYQRREEEGGLGNWLLNRYADVPRIAFQALASPITVPSKLLNVHPELTADVLGVASLGKLKVIPKGGKIYRGMQSLKQPKSPWKKGSIDVDAFDPSTRVEPMTSSSIRKYEALRKQAATRFDIERRAAIAAEGGIAEGTFAMAKSPKKLTQKQQIANEIKIAIPDETSLIPQSIPSEYNYLSKLPRTEQVRIIGEHISRQYQADKLTPKSKLLTSAQSLGSGTPIYNQTQEVKLSLGLDREAPWMLKKFGFLWDSRAEQAHHSFQKAFTAPVVQHMVKLARDPNSPITWYDVANLEAALQSIGIPGIGHSGVEGILEPIHQYVHKSDRQLGQEPTGGIPLATSEMTPKQLKAEKARIKAGTEEGFPGPSLGILTKEITKLKTAGEITKATMEVAEEFYVPQIKRMRKLNEAAKDDFTHFRNEVELRRLRRDDIKDIRKGRKPNVDNLTDKQLAERQRIEEEAYLEARIKMVESAKEISKRRELTEEELMNIRISKSHQAAQDYYLDWLEKARKKKERWVSGGKTRGYGRIRQTTRGVGGAK